MDHDFSDNHAYTETSTAVGFLPIAFGAQTSTCRSGMATAYRIAINLRVGI